MPLGATNGIYKLWRMEEDTLGDSLLWGILFL